MQTLYHKPSPDSNDLEFGKNHTTHFGNLRHASEFLVYDRCLSFLTCEV